jgi:glycosyltransferase involved in cell wall biosynthesis
MPEQRDPGLRRDIDVMTLGNISPDKRQLDQLHLAAEMPDRRFAIVGAVMSKVYLGRLRNVIRSRRLTNVDLVVDAPAWQVSEYLFRSRIFLHTKAEEHFGISVAQAIAHGCVPIVHDSGGQVEIVTDPTLRFRSPAELRRILRDVLAGELPDPGPALEMRLALERFTPGRFRQRFKALLG